MATRLQKVRKPLCAMVFPQVMQSQLIALESGKYTPMFASTMAQRLDMVNPHVPIPSTTSPITKRPTKLKQKRPSVLKSPPQINPTSAVS